MKVIRLTLLLILIPISAFAAPTIDHTSDTWSHGQTVTIYSTGTDFGSKNPVAPLCWDSCAHSNPLSTYYSEVEPGSCQNSNYNMAYRTAPWNSYSGNTIVAASPRSTRIIAGAHAPNTSGGWTWECGQNVALTVDNAGDNGWGSTNFYALYYYRADPSWEPPDGTWDPPGPNLKEFSVQDQTEIYTATYDYIDYCNDEAPNYNNPNSGHMKDNETCSSCSPPNGNAIPNILRSDVGPDSDGWMKWEWQVAYGSGGFRKLLVGNVVDFNCNSNNSLGFTPGSLSIGGYTRPRFTHPERAFRYFSEVYIDNTFSRVILANNAIYNSATIREPQIPSAWSTSQITATVNLGKLPDSGTAYLFVCDSANLCNSTGYEITLGEGGPYIESLLSTGVFFYRLPISGSASRACFQSEFFRPRPKIRKAAQRCNIISAWA